MASRETYFASCPPGLETVLLDEVGALELARREQQVGGVYFEGRPEDAWRACLGLRTAIRVFQRVARFEARDADELYQGAKQVDWSRFVRADGTLMVDSQSRDSALFHTHFIQQRVKDAVVDQLRERYRTRPSVDVDDPDLRIHVHLFRDRATVSVDASGGSLHKRGWREHQGRAPLSEVLAAGIVALSRWDRRAPFLDPFCGSGTLAIEAASLAAGLLPGSWRRFGFERWPGHDAAAFEALRTAMTPEPRAPGKLRILASDLDESQVEGARANARAAGVEDWIEFDVRDARRMETKPGWGAWVVTNPPYGLRVGDVRELEPLYEDFGELLRARCEGYRVALLSGNAELARKLRFKGDLRTTLANGAIDCRLMQLVVGEGAPEDEPEDGPGNGPARGRRRRARRTR